jgi:hypothetical protein
MLELIEFAIYANSHIHICNLRKNNFCIYCFSQKKDPRMEVFFELHRKFFKNEV